MQYTQNFNLNLPEDTDPLEISKISENFEKLDEVVEQKARESGFQVGDLLQTTRGELSEGWALCNGDILDPEEYPDYAQSATDPVTMFIGYTPTIDLGDCRIAGIANGCIVEDKYLTYLKYYGTTVPNVTAVWVDCEAQTVEEIDFTASSNEGLNYSRCFTIYNPVEKMVYYYNGTNIYKSGIKGALSKVGPIQCTWPTANSLALNKAAYRNGKYSLYFTSGSLNVPTIIQSAYPDFSLSITVNISMASGTVPKTDSYAQGKPGEVIYFKSAGDSRGIAYLNEDADGGFSQKFIPTDNFQPITSIEMNASGSTTHVPTSDTTYSVSYIKYFEGKYYLIYRAVASYQQSTSVYYHKTIAHLISMDDLSSGVLTELYSVSYVYQHPSSGSNQDIINTNNAITHFIVSPARLREELYFLPESCHNWCPVLKMDGDVAVKVLDTVYNPSSTSGNTVLNYSLQYQNYAAYGVSWTKVKSVAFKIWNSMTGWSNTTGATRLAIWPDTRAPLLADSDIVRNIVKIK